MYEYVYTYTLFDLHYVGESNSREKNLLFGIFMNERAFGEQRVEKQTDGESISISVSIEI